MVLEHTRPEREMRLLPEVTHLIDLGSTLEALRNEPDYVANGRNGTTLVKNTELRMVLQAMLPGARLLEHHAPGPITVQVLDGEIEFSVGSTVHTIRRGEMLALPARVPHAVHAVRESAFLLTIAPLAGPRE
ncbi:MAG: cupin domain-containing protein [Actinomycetota bacterium]